MTHQKISQWTIWALFILETVNNITNGPIPRHALYLCMLLWALYTLNCSKDSPQIYRLIALIVTVVIGLFYCYQVYLIL
ncbi:MAG: hypothetical protein IJ196_07690 [Prevotella sp.]|nr:hypothetical protein [Prevotella sp.]